MRKNYLSTENCKPTRVLAIICSLAFIIGLLQYFIYEAGMHDNNTDNDHKKVIYKGSFDSADDTQEIINEAFKHMETSMYNSDGTKSVDGIAHKKISDIEPDNPYAVLGDEADSKNHLDYYGETANGDEDLNEDKNKGMDDTSG